MSSGGPSGLEGPIAPVAAAAIAPTAWWGWKAIQGSVNVSLRAGLKHAAIVNTATMREISGGGLRGPVGR